MYSITKRVLEAETQEEAKSILFGFGGIQINTETYYKDLISAFVKKKDSLLKIKEDKKQIIYNLENVNDLWSILFIAKILKKEIENLKVSIGEKIEELSSEDARLLEFLKSPEQKDQKKINNERKQINKRIKRLEASKEKLDSDISELFFKYDSPKFKYDIEFEQDITLREDILKNIKEAIKTIHIMRNIISHDGIRYTGSIIFSNEGVQISIPPEYIDGFNKGKIIAKQEDKDAVEYANENVYPLLEQLGYDARELESFFYNAEPKQLSYILKLSNNDINILYQLPKWVFYERNNTILQYLIKGNTFFDEDNLEILKTIKYVPYSDNNQSIIEIYEYIKQNNESYSNEDLDILNEIGKRQIINIEDVKRKIDILRKYGIKLNGIQDKYSYFLKDINPDSVVNLIEKYGINQVSYFINNLPNVFSYTFKELEDIYITYKQRNDEKIFLKSTSNTLKYFNFVNDYLKNRGINDNRIYYELLSLEYHGDVNVINICDKFNMVYEKYNTIKYIDTIIFRICLNYKISNDNFLKIIDFFHNYQNINQIYNFDVEVITKTILDCPNIDLINETLYEKLNLIIGNGYFLMYDGNPLNEILIGKYLNGLITMDEVFDRLNKKKMLRREILFEEINIVNEYCQFVLHEEEKIHLFKELSECLINYEKYKDKLDENKKIFLDNFIKDKMTKVFQMWNNSISKESIQNYITRIFSFIKNDNLDNLESNIASINKYDSLIESNNVDAIEFYFDKINRFLYYDLISKENSRKKDNFKKENIDYLLSKFSGDYAQLRRLPYEFFVNDISALDSMMIDYNQNIAKSIYGIDDAKTVAILSYANSVFTRYNAIHNDYQYITFDLSEVIHCCFNDTYKYRSNISSVDMNQEQYLKQFIITGDNLQDEINENNDYDLRDHEQINKNIINKLRNSFAHFRFKPVKDENGNIITDKIYLYDAEDEVNYNFNLIIDLNYLLELIHRIENDLNTKSQTKQNSRK